MSIDSDLSASLPDPPPPRPDRREAAIDAALRRFDGADDPPRAAGRPRATTPARWWTGITRPQAGALVTAALVALVTPLAWMSSDHPRPAAVDRTASIRALDTAPTSPAPASQPTPSPQAEMAPPAAVAPSREPAPAPAPLAEPDASAKVSAPPPAVVAPPAEADMAIAPDIRAERRAPAFAPAPAPAPPPPPAAFAAAPVAAPVVTATAAPRADLGFTANKRSAAMEENIVVTGQRRMAAKPVGRGDWNACTVNDPSHNLGGCKALVNPAASGPAGRAAAHVADGLSQAWQGDFDAAIAAFDQAIAIAPRLSFAYLNRGLAYQHQGDLARAIADLDQAVRYAPGTARGYYQRGLLLRQRGDLRRAQADENRAVELDERYQAVVR